MTRQAIRVDDDRNDDGMGAAGYATVIVLTVWIAILIAVVLWLPALARRWGWL